MTIPGPRATRVRLGLLAVFALLPAVGCGRASTIAQPNVLPAGGTVISIDHLAFTPAAITVTVGTTVTWRNDEPITHMIASGTLSGVDPSTGLRSGQKPDGLFTTRLTGLGDTYSYTFINAGTFTYFCELHYGMNAQITVVP